MGWLDEIKGYDKAARDWLVNNLIPKVGIEQTRPFPWQDREAFTPQSYGTPPPKEERPEESEAGRFIRNYQDFVTAGGSQMVFEDEQGNKTSIKNQRAKAEQPKQPQGQGGATITQGTPWSAQMPSGPMETGTQNWGTAMTPGGGYTSPEQKAVQEAQNMPYAPRWRPGEEPLDARAEYKKRLEMIQQAFPTRGEALKEAYGGISARFGKGMRVLMSILNQDPFYTDKLAAAEAEFNDKRRMGIYTASTSALDKLTEREKVEKATIAQDLISRLKVNPGLSKNVKFNRDYAISSLGIPADQADQYVKDHTDPKTGEIQLIKDPYTEHRIVTVQSANLIQEMYGLPSDIAIRAASQPQLLLDWFQSDLKQLDMKLAAEKDPQKKLALERMKERITAVRGYVARDPNYASLLVLEDQRRSYWNTMTPQQKADWQKRYTTLNQYIFGPTGKNADDIFIDREKDIAQINETKQKTEYYKQQIENKAKAGGGLTIIEDIVASQPGQASFRSKNIGTKQKEEMLLKDQIIRDRAKVGEKFTEPADKAYVQRYVAHIWNLFPRDLQDQLKDISPREAVQAAEAIATAQSRATAAGVDPSQSYSIHDLFNAIMISRRGVNRK